jgi:hypothetical protein
MDMILKAAKEVTQSFAIEPNLEVAEELKKEYLSGDIAMELSKTITAQYSYLTAAASGGSRAIIEWWSNGDTWSKMNEFEKETLIEKYLRPMSNGRYVRWEVSNNLPNDWKRNVQGWMGDAGVAGAIANKYNGDHLASPETTKKFFGTEEEREAKRQEEDIEMYVKRQEQSMGRRMTPAEIEAIRDTYNPPPRPTLPGTLRGTLGEPRAAGAPRMTEREKVIEELTAAFGGREPTEEEIERVLRNRNVEERIARLKKALTETKIRAKIRRVLREAE